jgi:tetratricopeptide (TPR) repeat protein
MQAGDHRAAIEHFAAALAIEPGLLTVREFLGRSHLALKEGDAALGHIEYLLELGYGGADMHLLAAQVYVMGERWPDAEACYRRAIAVGTWRNEDLTESVIGLFDMLVRQGQDTTAVRFLEREIRAGGPVATLARYHIRMAWTALRWHDDAAFVRNLIALEEMGSTWEERRVAAENAGLYARDLVQTGNFGRAEQLARTAATIFPEVPSYAVLCRLANLLWRRQVDEARALMASDHAFAQGEWLASLVDIPALSAAGTPEA